jgi:hypothetical protein
VGLFAVSVKDTHAPACKTNVQDDDQTTAPEPHTGLQGEGGSSPVRGDKTLAELGDAQE